MILDKLIFKPKFNDILDYLNSINSQLHIAYINGIDDERIRFFKGFQVGKETVIDSINFVRIKDYLVASPRAFVNFDSNYNYILSRETQKMGLFDVSGEYTENGERKTCSCAVLDAFVFEALKFLSCNSPFLHRYYVDFQVHKNLGKDILFSKPLFVIGDVAVMRDENKRCISFHTDKDVFVIVGDAGLYFSMWTSNTVNIANINTSFVSSMRSLFYANNVIGYEGIDTHNVLTMDNMFENFAIGEKVPIHAIDISKWRIRSSCNVEDMFFKAKAERVILPKSLKRFRKEEYLRKKMGIDENCVVLFN